MYKKIYYPEHKWEDLLAGSFCWGMLAHFASHPQDRLRAEEMFYKARANNIGIDKICQKAQEHLKAHGASDELINEELASINNFYKIMNEYRKTKKKAWLITWEYKEQKAFSSDNLISIFDSHIGCERIANFIEQYYMANKFTLENKFFFSFRKNLNPYPVVYSRTNDGIQYVGDMKCGENPYIHARVVKNLNIIKNGNTYTLKWDDIDYNLICKR